MFLQFVSELGQEIAPSSCRIHLSSMSTFQVFRNEAVCSDERAAAGEVRDLAFRFQRHFRLVHVRVFAPQAHENIFTKTDRFREMT